MKAFKFYIIIVFLLWGNFFTNAQNLKGQWDEVYGLSPLLYNGKIYSDFYNDEVKGNQFLWDNTYRKGYIQLNQGYFKELAINYDIYQQKLLLQFVSQNKATRQIEIPLEHLVEFKIDDRLFQIFHGEDQSYNIYQIIGVQNTKFYLSWYKNLQTIKASSSYKHEFTDAKKIFQLLKDEQLIHINNNKTLRQCYPKALQTNIKKWMKAQNIKLQKANDEELLKLCQYLDSL